MPDLIRVKRGNRVNLPTLNDGEFGLSEDTKELFIGSTSGNQRIPIVPPATATWTAPTLLNSWVNFGAGYVTAGYYKDDLNIVRIRGLLKSGLTASSTQLFVLPAGYRPSLTEVRGCFSSNAGTITTSYIEINTVGSVYISGGAPGNTNFLLDFTFRAEL